MQLEYSSITMFLTDICNLHDSFSRGFLEAIKDESWNLKNQQVRNVIEESKTINPQFIQYLQKYYTKLNKLYPSLEYEYGYEKWDFRFRVKQMDSTINKLLFYRYGKEEEGKVPINKCLNDLLGFRMVINGYDYNCGKFDSICRDFKKNHYRIKKETRLPKHDEYKATHVYFHGNNIYFPWELQIWDTKDVQQNEISHKKHRSKREYINWPQSYKGSSEYVNNKGVKGNGIPLYCDSK